ncbi:hypothetical protein [Paenibacillus pini]|uniref:hypothetical protein n=1 Tax=Paenibacillus pini TaxID=669461 RepID=UPI00056743C9|nr:hypothetical protein [Paenibacillus pini]
MSKISLTGSCDYIVIKKNYLIDDKITWQAKGMYTYLLSVSENATFNLNVLKTISKNGRDSTANIINELESNGYIKRIQSRNISGQFDKNKVAVRNL